MSEQDVERVRLAIAAIMPTEMDQCMKEPCTDTTYCQCEMFARAAIDAMRNIAWTEAKKHVDALLINAEILGSTNEGELYERALRRQQVMLEAFKSLFVEPPKE